MKKNLLILILMIILVPLTGELKFYLFQNTFRVSLGSATFLFFLLWVSRIPVTAFGLIVGASVVIFRVFLDCFFNGSLLLVSSLKLHTPAFFYYLTYSSLFYLGKVNQLHNRPFLLGVASVIIEIFSSFVELSLRYFYLHSIIEIKLIGEIIIIAVIRSFFVLSFFYIIKLREATLASEQQQRQNKHMLLLISTLYEESIQLKKSLQQSEDITRDCYDLYRKLQGDNYNIELKELSQKLLSMAGQVHEIKKDNQRIYAGLAKMISNENHIDYMNVVEICSIVVQTNSKYAVSAGKNIEFNLNIDDVLPPFHVYTTLSLINNLVSNSVESIKEFGKIDLSVKKAADWVELKVCDNGPGIPEKKMDLIFKPGYTTKYDLSGKPSTGMGLPYIKVVVDNLNGTLHVNSNPGENVTCFTINLPIIGLVEKG